MQCGYCALKIIWSPVTQVISGRALACNCWGAEFRITKIPDYTRSPFPTSPSLSFFLSSHTVWSTAVKSEILTGTTENRFCARYTVCVCSPCTRGACHLCMCMHTSTRALSRIIYIGPILVWCLSKLACYPIHPSFSLFIWCESKRISVHPLLGFCCLRWPHRKPPPTARSFSHSVTVFYTGRVNLYWFLCCHKKMHLAIVLCDCSRDLWRE